MPNIFSFPIGLHFPDVRELCEDLRGLLSQICDNTINRRIVYPEEGLSHQITYFYFMEYIKQIMLDMLLPIPLNELMGVIVNSGLLNTAKKLGKFLKDHPNISRLDEQALELLKSILMDAKNPKKSLYVGFLALQVLYSRHLEESSVRHIKNMLNHTLLRADVVEVLRGWYRTSLTMTNSFFCETDDNIFNEMFGLFFNRIAWFDVMNRGILQAPPPPPPQLPPIVQPQIEDNIV